jgi:hypothetical protein
VRFRVGGDGQNQVGTGRVVPMTEAERLNTLRELFDAKYAWSDSLMIDLCPQILKFAPLRANPLSLIC